MTLQNTAAEELTSVVADTPVVMIQSTLTVEVRVNFMILLYFFAEQKPGVNGVIHTL